MAERKVQREKRGSRLTNILILSNLLIFLLIFSMPEEMLNSTFSALSLSSSTSIEIWRWFTSLFMHASASHLFFNMLGLYFFGRALEEKVTEGWFMAIYLVSGLLGNLAFVLTSPDSVVGASGAIFGVMGAAMLLNPLKKVYMYVFPLPLGMVAILFILIESLMVIFRPEQVGVSGVAHVAHIGGVVAGTVFAFFYRPKRSAKGLGFLALLIVILILLAPILGFVTGIGGLILDVVDSVVGFFLYTAANMLSFIWA